MEMAVLDQRGVTIARLVGCIPLAYVGRTGESVVRADRFGRC